MLRVIIVIFATFTSAAAWSLDCQCVAVQGLCSFKLFDDAAGQPRITWTQEFFPPGGQSTAHDRALACWRKRDVDGLGNGLCCSLNNDESDADRYFRGD